MRFSSITGEPHFNASVAFGATFLRIARISRRLFRASSGAASMYSSTVVGFFLVMPESRIPAWRGEWAPGNGRGAGDTAPVARTTLGGGKRPVGGNNRTPKS